MSDEDDRFVTEVFLDAVIEDVVGHVRVQRAQRVVQQVDVPVAVQRTGQADSLSLAATQSSAALPDLCRETKRID